MPELSFNSPARLVANVHLSTTTVCEPSLTIVDHAAGVVSIDLGDSQVGVQLVGTADTLAGLLSDALHALHGTLHKWEQEDEPPCWCGARSYIRCDDLGLAVSAPEGVVLCEAHHDQLRAELLDEAQEVSVPPLHSTRWYFGEPQEETSRAH